MRKNNKFSRIFATCIIFTMGVMSFPNISNAFNVVELDSKDNYSYGSTAGVLSAIEDILEKSSLDEIEDKQTLIEEIASIKESENNASVEVVTDITPIIEADFTETDEIANKTDNSTEIEEFYNEKEDSTEMEESSNISKDVSIDEKDQTDEAIVEEDESKESEQTEDDESDDWTDKLMADVDDKLNVRAEASEDGELAGKLRKGDVATVIDEEGDWIKISSGNLEGYVLSDYCVTGDEAKALADETCKTYAKVQTDGLRIRKEPSEEASIVDLVSSDDHVFVDKEAEDIEGWVGVTFEGQNGYVNSDYVELEVKYSEAITIEEEQAAIAAQKEKEAKEKQNKQNPAMSAGADEVTLLAALIQCEAGRSGYDGQLAVGAVVCNRARRGYGGGSISGVIYQPGQFPPATNGIMAGVLSSGVSGSCIQAAQAALGGADNTGGAVNFRSASSGMGGTVIGGNVFF